MSQMNPKEAFHNTAYSVQLPYIAYSLQSKNLNPWFLVGTKNVLFLVFVLNFFLNID